jgi:hypothetical protein
MAFQLKLGSFEIESKVFEGFRRPLRAARIGLCETRHATQPGN